MLDSQVRKDILSVSELAAEFGVSPGLVYAMANRGELPSVRFGRVFRFRRSTVEAWVEARERGANA